MERGERGNDPLDKYGVNLLMRVHHINLTSLVGYCNDENHIGLVYEYMENGNLQAYLSDSTPVVFTWEGRLQIAIDAAQGVKLTSPLFFLFFSFFLKFFENSYRDHSISIVEGPLLQITLVQQHLIIHYTDEIYISPDCLRFFYVYGL
ncbi:unnamed protein product, partial [Prunus brigantina]